MNRLAAALLLGPACLAAPALPAAAQAPDPGTIKSMHSAELGDYITDGAGRALYILTADTQGRGSNPAVSTCAEACAKAWPPFLVAGAMPQVRSNAQTARLGSMKRPDGTTQVTYDGWPLYYYAGDGAAGEVKGQKTQAFGGQWWLLAPRGAKVGEAGPQPDLADH